MDLSLYHLDSTLLHMHGAASLLHQQQQCNVPLFSPTSRLPDLATLPPELAASLFRRVFSTGDLKQEQSTQAESVGGGMVVVRYSPEERRERVDKYRSKRNHRNFHKKITYACRKTMADSRLRVKGRFARNPDSSDQPNDINIVAGHNRIGIGEEGEEGIGIGEEGEEGNGGVVVNHGGAGIANVPEWWPAMQEALEREKEDEVLTGLLLHCNDDEFVSAYLGISPVNLYSSH